MGTLNGATTKLRIDNVVIVMGYIVLINEYIFCMKTFCAKALHSSVLAFPVVIFNKLLLTSEL